jgi:cell division protein FtsN
VVEAKLSGRTWYRVIVGPFPDVETANAAMGTVRSAGASDVAVLPSG